MRAWLESWIVSVLVTAALLGLSWIVGQSLRTWYASLIVIALSSIWAAWDSGRIRLQHYKTQMANEPFVVFFMCLMLWILFFPWYVIIRQGIKRGLVRRKEKERP